MVACQISPKIESLYGLGIDKPQNYKVRICMGFCNFCEAAI